MKTNARHFGSGHERRRLHDPDYTGPERRGAAVERRQGGGAADASVILRLSAIERRLDAGSKRMDLQDGLLAENTEITRDIRDLLTAARLGLKVLGGLGAVARWLGYLGAGGAALYTLWHMATHGGRPPGN